MSTVVSMLTLESILLHPHARDSPSFVDRRARTGLIPESVLPKPLKVLQPNGVPRKEEEEEEEVFGDSVETRSDAAASSVGDTEDCFLGSSNNIPSSEFYDAHEDFLSDCSASSSPLSANISTEIATLRVRLLEEIGRRKEVEDSLAYKQMQWRNAAACLSEVGLSFPPIPTAQKSCEIDDSVALVCQEVTVTRLVSSSLGRVKGRAEAEASADEVIQSKNHEISRLHARLRYHEAVNNEIRRLNQEVIELSGKRRRRRQQLSRWMWGLVGFSLTLGASYLAYSCLPLFQEALSSPSDDVPASLESAELLTD